MTNNLYLTKVGLISGGIGSRGPESGWAPGGGAGGKGGRTLMVRKLDFFFQVDFLRYVLVQIDLICTCPSHRARKAQRQPRAHRSPRCLGKSEDNHHYDHYHHHHHLKPLKMWRRVRFNGIFQIDMRSSSCSAEEFRFPNLMIGNYFVSG